MHVSLRNILVSVFSVGVYGLDENLFVRNDEFNDAVRRLVTVIKDSESKRTVARLLITATEKYNTYPYPIEAGTTTQARLASGDLAPKFEVGGRGSLLSVLIMAESFADVTQYDRDYLVGQKYAVYSILFFTITMLDLMNPSQIFYLNLEEATFERVNEVFKVFVNTEQVSLRQHLLTSGLLEDYVDSLTARLISDGISTIFQHSQTEIELELLDITNLARQLSSIIGPIIVNGNTFIASLNALLPVSSLIPELDTYTPEEQALLVTMVPYFTACKITPDQMSEAQRIYINIQRRKKIKMRARVSISLKSSMPVDELEPSVDRLYWPKSMVSRCVQSIFSFPTAPWLQMLENTVAICPALRQLQAHMEHKLSRDERLVLENTLGEVQKVLNSEFAIASFCAHVIHGTGYGAFIKSQNPEIPWSSRGLLQFTGEATFKELKRIATDKGISVDPLHMSGSEMCRFTENTIMLAVYFYKEIVEKMPLGLLSSSSDKKFNFTIKRLAPEEQKLITAEYEIDQKASEHGLLYEKLQMRTSIFNYYETLASIKALEPLFVLKVFQVADLNAKRQRMLY